MGSRSILNVRGWDILEKDGGRFIRDRMRAGSEVLEPKKEKVQDNDTSQRWTISLSLTSDHPQPPYMDEACLGPPLDSILAGSLFQRQGRGRQGGSNGA